MTWFLVVCLSNNVCLPPKPYNNVFACSIEASKIKPPLVARCVTNRGWA